MKQTLLFFWGTFICVSMMAQGQSDAEWKPALSKFGMTRWAKNVSPDHVLPEYPRPQMVRKEWINLNGLWDYGITGKGEPFPSVKDGKILVPFPLESSLSGVGKMINTISGRNNLNSTLWYRRGFHVPAKWKNSRILLHFGAVDWESKVYVNGKQAGVHCGGYDDFTIDITGYLNRGKENTLSLEIWDPTVYGGYPQGKQVNNPDGMLYTPCTGIWQTVWLEPVPTVSIEKARIIPDVDASTLKVSCSYFGQTEGCTIEAVVKNGQKVVVGSACPAGQILELTIPDPKLWTPDEPFLYNLDIILKNKRGIVLDKVESYAGMRKISLGKDQDGITRILLNNKFIFQNGVLDQGYWPDGNYTAPTDDALRYDIEMIKKLGFNMSRKHLKVEPERWYYWADKLGLMVWQDMPCMANGNPPAEFSVSTNQIKDQFGKELNAMIDCRFSHPSIVMWIVFNEGMGLKKTQTLEIDGSTRTFMRDMGAIAIKDTTRLINAESGAPGLDYQGWNKLDIGMGDIIDAHCYGTTICPSPSGERASVIGEYGYEKFTDAFPKYSPLVQNPGISGLVWTQLTDVENEKNGLMTFTRDKFTEDTVQVAALNRKLYLKINNAPSGKDIISFKTLLQELIDRTVIARAQEIPSRLCQASSYDRKSVNKDEEGWFANNDFSNYIRKEVNNGRDEYVVMDQEGPGAVTRFWTAGWMNKHNHLRFYFDDNEIPLWEADKAAKLIGQNTEIGYPLSYRSVDIDSVTYGGQPGHNLYAPLPFKKHLKITSDLPQIDWLTGFWYQVNYRLYNKDVPVESLTKSTISENKKELMQVNDMLKSYMKLSPGEVRVPGEKDILAFDYSIEPRGTKSFFIDNPGSIRRILISLRAGNMDEAMKNTWISLTFDNITTVEVPVGFFFGCGDQLVEVSDWFRKTDKDGNMACFWVMPYLKSAVVHLINKGEETISGRAEIAVGAWVWNSRSMYFHASFKRLDEMPAKAVKDFNYINLENQAGIYAGDVLQVEKWFRGWWGEGDEKIYIDGSTFPDHFGTGTEDYYGYAWGHPETFNQIFTNQPIGQAQSQKGGITVNSRVRSLDAIPFKKSFRFDMESWQQYGGTVKYAVACFWYGQYK